MKQHDTTIKHPELHKLLEMIITYIVENEMEMRNHRKNGHEKE